MQDNELREFLGLEIVGKNIAGEPLWKVNQERELFQLRSMAYDSMKSIEAILKYLNIELKEDNDKLGIYHLKAFKKSD